MQPARNVRFVQGQAELRHPEALGNDRQANRWSTSTKLFMGAALVTVIALATMTAMNAYTPWKNSNIEKIECRIGETVDDVDRDFQFFENAAKTGGKATDQYCFAKMHETGNGTTQSLSEARNWYKKAAAQGLTLAVKSLCRSSMFPETEFDFHEFESICCPRLGSLSLPKCPWYT